MIQLVRPSQPLSSSESRWRVAFVIALAATLAVLAAFDPVDVGRWTPFAISCGAVTGLPCVFCGMTRAIHFICVGDFGRAFYFNWLAFPVLTLGFVAAICAICEVGKQRRFVRLNLAFSPRVARYAVVLLVALWMQQAFLAVHYHKSELLNPRGPLYAFFVR